MGEKPVYIELLFFSNIAVGEDIFFLMACQAAG